MNHRASPRLKIGSIQRIASALLAMAAMLCNPQSITAQTFEGDWFFGLNATLAFQRDESLAPEGDAGSMGRLVLSQPLNQLPDHADFADANVSLSLGCVEARGFYTLAPESPNQGLIVFSNLVYPKILLPCNSGDKSSMQDMWFCAFGDLECGAMAYRYELISKSPQNQMLVLRPAPQYKHGFLSTRRFGYRLYVPAVIR